MMKNSQKLPKIIAERLAQIKKEHKHNVSIGIIHGKYYVMETTRTFSPEQQRYITTTFYMGRILNDGTFIKARHRKENTVATSLDEMIKKNNIKDRLNDLIHPDNADLKILELISKNSRIPINEIAREIGFSNSATKYRLSRLEKLYNISYTIEIAPRPFDYFRYIVFVKFMDIIPDSESIKKILLNEPTIQFAAITKGDYNLIFYIFAENTQVLENRIYDIRSSDIFANRNSEWIVSYMTYSYGYVPITDNFIEHMLKDRVWHKSKERPRRQKEQILEREYLVIKALNKNSRMDFSDIDKMYNLNDGASQYTYRKLIDNETILRTTIKMSNLPLKYNLILKCEQKNINEFNSKRLEYLLHTIDDTRTPINKYALIVDIGATYGLLLIAPIFNDNEDIEAEIKRHTNGITISTSIITRIIIGELGYRRINRLDTPQYKFIESAKNSSKQTNQ